MCVCVCMCAYCACVCLLGLLCVCVVFERGWFTHQNIVYVVLERGCTQSLLHERSLGVCTMPACIWHIWHILFVTLVSCVWVQLQTRGEVHIERVDKMKRILLCVHIVGVVLGTWSTSHKIVECSPWLAVARSLVWVSLVPILVRGSWS